MTSQNGDDLRLRRHFVEKKQIIRIYSNSFVYIRKKKHQFIRMYSNSFVYIGKKHQFIRIYSNSFVYIRKKTPIHSYIFELICIYCTKNTNSLVYIWFHSYIFEKKNNSFVYIRIHSYVFGKINVQIWKPFCF